MEIGGHLPSRDPLQVADATSSEVFQLHLSSPRTWADPKPRDDADTLAQSGRLVSVHAPYLINPASPNPTVRERSLKLMTSTMLESARCGAAGVVVHAGSAGADGTVEEGVERWLEFWPKLPDVVPVLIENTASGKASPGRHLDSIELLFSSLRSLNSGPALQSCLDTAHAFVGDPTCVDDPEGWAAKFAEVTGGVAVIHVNDSTHPAGSGRDTHAHLAEGHLGLAGIAAMLRGADAPAAVLETPGVDESRIRDTRILRYLADTVA